MKCQYQILTERLVHIPYPYEDLPIFSVHDIWLADEGCI